MTCCPDVLQHLSFCRFSVKIRTVNENNPFMRHNGIRVIFLDGERAQVAVQAADFSRNAMGSIHGGLFFLMGETAAGLLVRSDGRRYVTLDVSFRYLRASVGERELQAEAVWIRRGRSVAVCRALIREKGSEKALAEGEFSFFLPG